MDGQKLATEKQRVGGAQHASQTGLIIIDEGSIRQVTQLACRCLSHACVKQTQQVMSQHCHQEELAGCTGSAAACMSYISSLVLRDKQEAELRLPSS